MKSLVCCLLNLFCLFLVLLNSFINDLFLTYLLFLLLMSRCDDLNEPNSSIAASHRAPAWSEGTAARPAGSSEVHSTTELWSLRSETPAPPWRSCTGPSWSRRPAGTRRGGARTTPTRTRRKRRERSFCRPGPSEPSAPAGTGGFTSVTFM